MEMQILHEHDLQEMWDPSMNRGVWVSYQFRLRWYQNFIRQVPSRILEAGCAQATLGLLLAEQGHEVVAVDIRENFLRYAAERQTHGTISFKNLDLTRDGAGGEFDLIYLNQVLEHTCEPTKILEKLRESLAPCGRILMTTPSHRYFRNRLPSFRAFLQTMDGTFAQNTADGGDHVFAYSMTELQEICRASGLRVLKAGFYETPLLSGHAGFRFINRFLPVFILEWLERLVSGTPILKDHLCYQLYVMAERDIRQGLLSKDRVS